MPGEFSQPDI